MAIPEALIMAAAKEGGRAVKGDLAVLTYQKPPKKVGKGKKAQMVPGRITEIHISPAAAGIGLAGLAGAVVVGLVAWDGIKIPVLLGEVTVIHGLKGKLKGDYKNRAKALVDKGKVKYAAQVQKHKKV